jgi:hypothetical protein
MQGFEGGRSPADDAVAGMPDDWVEENNPIRAVDVPRSFWGRKNVFARPGPKGDIVRAGMPKRMVRPAHPTPAPA